EKTVAELSGISSAAEQMARASRAALSGAGVDPAAVEAGAADALDALTRLSRSNASAAESAAAAVEEINASMEEMSASASELSQIAGELQADVRRFRTGEDADPPAQAVTFTAPRLVDLTARHAAAA
ncbi:MAG TPA: hypothetical protein VEQ60_07130, partial [Longimicrobium sp.]|nr:hypothetical protein [Longimicrobium sp.]